MKTRATLVAIVCAALLLQSCATPTLDTVAEPASGELQEQFQSLQNAKKSEKDLVAPLAFSDAMEAYDEAAKTQGNRRPQAILASEQALERFQKTADWQAGKLGPILQARADAIVAGGRQNQPDAFADLEERLSNLAATLEKNPDTPLSKWLAEFSEDYRKLELRTLKSNILDEARNAIELARNQEVDDYAPKTLARAEEELLMGIAILERDRSKQAEARQQAANSLAQVAHAREIMAQAKKFEQEKATYEDMLLWHEGFVAEAFGALLPEQMNRLPSAAKLSATLDTLIQGKREAESRGDRLQNELLTAQKREEQLRQQSVATLEDAQQALLATQLAADAERRLATQREARLRTVRDLFAPTEADVYQQGDNILIRAHGFEFPVGSSKVGAVNLPLVSKIISAIEQFPDRRVRVTGHTDSLGDDGLNRTLSEDRARSVATMLTDIGLIDASRIDVAGLGETQPVANNETAAGRAANRRVEVEILSTDSPAP